MERLKPKEQRLISFALDLGTHVRVRETGDREPAKLVKAVNGILQVHYFKGEQKTYEISNQTERPKALYIEVPIRKWMGAVRRFAKARLHDPEILSVPR